LAFLEVIGLTKYFGGLAAVKDLTFHVDQGEILGLIGPNGSGKTTTFNLITGVYKPTSGTIKFKGERIDKLPPHKICKKGIARTHQIVAPFSNMTVLENVMTGLTYGRSGEGKSLKEIRDESVEIVNFVGLGKKTDVLAKNLTLAERKRLEVARALATKPELLLLDEAVAGLNPTETSAFLETIRKIRESGVTIIMVEHVMRCVMSLSDRIVVLNYGRKIAEGSPQEICQNKAVIEAYLGESYA